MKKNDFFTSQIICLFMVLVATGCSSVPRTNSGARGLFQTQESGAPGAVVGSEAQIDSREPSIQGFRWPLKEGKISSFFGNRKRDFHEGIDIKANRGTAIYAAKSGDVIYSSKRIHGYGNMIVLKHDNGLSTIYAHNKVNFVHRGQKVKQGELIAYVGATGKATGPHLHFEIRKKEVPLDPLLYLPQIRTVAASRDR